MVLLIENAKMKTLLFLLSLSIFFSCAAQGQKLVGKVTNQDIVPIEDVVVYHTSSNAHTHSNNSGVFRMKQLSKGDTLILNRVGFEELYVVVNNVSDTLRVTLYASVSDMNEVVILESIDALKLKTRIDLKTTPVNNSQEILRKVPGLLIGQHAGGGKAEQLFMRGFDLDHGTDINLTADGLPVNMVSHAHGQGYADLHFLIPETVDKIDFGKGPYYADQGNFATAGHVAFKTKEQLSQSLIKLDAGQFNSKRILGMFNLLSAENKSAYVAAEINTNDGPFESPQNFKRIILLAKYTTNTLGNGKLSTLFSHFTSAWDASGQVPQRAVDSGLISRFGAIDNREGGNTQRTNFKLDYTKKINENTIVKSEIYYSIYNFELFSNFTFFLHDSVNGDQIKQKEKRTIFGVKSELKNYFTLGKIKGSVSLAAGIRSDATRDSELSHTANRQIVLNRIQLGDISEANYYTYINSEINKGKWLLNLALRLDYFENSYNNELDTNYAALYAKASIASPKCNVVYNYSKFLQLYLKTGRGFHSNDTRVVVQTRGKEILPSATGADMGFIWKPNKNMIVNAASWFLFMEQEFVYVGDEGIVEPSGSTQRYGIDVGVQYQIADWLIFNADVNQCVARTLQDERGNNYIPLAPDLTATGGISVLHPKGFFGGVRARYMNNRPANSDYSIVAQGYTILDLNAGYRFKNIDLSFSVENVLNTEWNETQFATTSRLKGEEKGVEEIHFTPGSPFFFKASLGYMF